MHAFKWVAIIFMASIDETDVQAEAFQLLKSALAAASGENIYQVVFEQFSQEAAHIEEEISRCVNAQVTKASSFIDLLVRAQETVETARNDASKLTSYGETEEDFPPDVSILMQHVGHGLSNALATQELYEKVVSVPARAAVVAGKWARREMTPVSVFELQKEILVILKNRDDVRKLPKQYVSSLTHLSSLKTIQLDKLSAELTSIATSFDNTFFKSALDLSRELSSYITDKMPAQIFDSNTTARRDIGEIVEQLILNLSAQETLEERGAAKAWIAIVNTVYNVVIPDRYEQQSMRVRPHTFSNRISKHSERSAMATVKNDSDGAKESGLQAFLNTLLSTVQEDLEHIKMHIEPPFRSLAANVIVEAYHKGIGIQETRLVPGAPLSPNNSHISVASIFNLPLVYVSAIHNHVQGVLRNISETVALTQEVLHSLIAFASSYTTELDSRGFHWAVCRFPDAVYFQNIARGTSHTGMSPHYRSWHSSLTSIFEDGMAEDSKAKGSNYAMMRTDGKFFDLAPFSAQASSHPCMFTIHDCVLNLAEVAWSGMSSTDKAITIDMVLSSLTGSKDSTMKSQLKTTMVEQKARDLFFVNAYSLEAPMQSVVSQYKKDVLRKFCKACYEIQLTYVRDLDISRPTSEGTIITGVVSTIFAIFLEQLRTIDLTSDLGKCIFLETYNAACTAIKNLVYDILGNISGIDPPMNIQYLCRIIDSAYSFNNLLASDAFWSVKREGLNSDDFQFLSETLGSSSLISPQALASELTNKTEPLYRVSDTKFGGLFGIRRRPRQMGTDTSNIMTAGTHSRNSSCLTGLSLQEPLTSQATTGQSNIINSDTSSICGCPVAESLWSGEQLETRHYIALANDIDLIPNSLEELTDFVKGALKSESFACSVIEAQVSSVKEVISEALNVVASKLVYVVLSTFRDSHIARLFTTTHDQSLVNDLTLDLRNTFERVTNTLSDILQYLIQIEISNLFPAAYFCALFWRYYENLKSNKDKSFSNTTFSNMYESDVECICKMLQDIGVANKIVDNRRNLMKAFETGLKTVNISTENLTAISSSISGASVAVYLLMHPKIQGDDFVKRLSSVPYHESDFYRASFLDRALYRGHVYSYDANCKEVRHSV
ncbi:Hypothetical protein GLP15_2765 [Giardia lamblia P15]|uniref:Uncharacterized protein n=1 Tax=Giardia intestinalis (strain P15) TaxID=658858 RepID=E1F3F5_GIAIA|nr:Hypothetical protein GLP15_2765 [Giardia lamblia P15]